MTNKKRTEERGGGEKQRGGAIHEGIGGKKEEC